MLTKDLLRYRVEDGRIQPTFLDPESLRYAQATRDLIEIFDHHLEKSQRELAESIETYAARRTDYRIIRGLARVIMGFAEFEDPKTDARALRTAVFERAASVWPVVRGGASPPGVDRGRILEEVANQAGIPVAQLENDLYADLPERRRLQRLAAPREPEALIARYNMELARGLLYWAERMTIDVEDSYQDVFRYIKLCRLMHTITRRAQGYRIELDGPLSLLRGTTRYGLKMAVFLPALALCQTWRMEAVIVKRGERLIFSLDERSDLVSHFRRFPAFDSQLERDFATDFQRTFPRHSHEWSLTRADAVIPVERNEVMIPDFTLRDRGGQEIYLEIVGFWTQEYLSKKIAKVRAARLNNLILAVSKSLTLNGGGTEEFNIVWFDRKLSASAVIAYINLMRSVHDAAH
jgi:predicted nuclease of restriction endonuclease-like RecB superfamily